MKFWWSYASNLNHFILFSVRALTCYCKGHCPQHLDDPSKDGTCEAKENASCFSAVEEVLDPETNRLVPERTYGCLPPDETGFLQCKGKKNLDHKGGVFSKVKVKFRHETNDYNVQIFTPTKLSVRAAARALLSQSLS